MVTVFTNAIPSIALGAVVGAAGLGTCAAAGCEPERAQFHVGRPHVFSRNLAPGEPVEVTTTVRAGKGAVINLVIRLFDGTREVASEHLAYLAPRQSAIIHQRFTPEICGVHELSIIAGNDELRRRGPRLRVACSDPGEQRLQTSRLRN
jgi:hypothetical protein